MGNTAANISFAAIGAEEAEEVKRWADAIWRVCYVGILSEAQIAYMLERMYAPARIRHEMAEGVKWEWVIASCRRIGYLSYSCDAGSRQAHLHKIYLLPEEQGKGIGQKCLTRAAAAAAAAGCRVLDLNVNKRNRRAIGAYEKFGFRIAAAVVVDIGSGFVMDDYLMEYQCARDRSP